MRHLAYLALVVLILGSGLRAQAPDRDPRAHIAGIVEGRLKAELPVELSADSITLNGKVLHLKGHVRIVWLPDTLIRAEEATINDGRLELIGSVTASLGSASGTVPTLPKVEYR